MSLWPAGWRHLGYATAEDQGWRPAVKSSAHMPSVFTPKEAAAIVQRYRPAAALAPVQANGSGYGYLVDMGRELQGTDSSVFHWTPLIPNPVVQSNPSGTN